MACEIFLNEQSIPATADFSAASGSLKGLIDTLRSARKLAGQLCLNSHVSIHALEIGGHSIAALRNGGNLEESQFLKALVNRAPHERTLVELNGPDMAELDYHLADSTDDRAVGLGLAHAFDAMAISIALHERWHVSEVALLRSRINSTGIIEEDIVSARNACRADELNKWEEWLLDRRFDGIYDGKMLWERRALIYPRLDFIPRVEAQICRIPEGDPLFANVAARLRDIDRAIERWDPGQSGRPQYPCNVRPESDSRINRGLVDFRDSNGSIRTFSDHADIAPGENRLHFILEMGASPRGLVGHVGRKLGIG